MGFRTVLSTLVLTAAVFTHGGIALGQTPSEVKMTLAREVVSLAGGEELVTSTMDVMAPAVRADVLSRGVDEAFADRFTELFIEEFRRDMPRILELSAIAYAGAFSESELRDIRDFYASPTGRAVRERGPDMTNAMTRAGMIIGEEAATRAVERITAERAAQPHAP